MEKLPRLRFKRDNIKGQLNRLQTYYEGVDKQNLTDLIVTQLEYRLNKVESIYEEFNELQTEIEFILDDSEESNLQAISDEIQLRVDFENSYFELVPSIKNIIAIFYNKQSNNGNEIINENCSIKSSVSDNSGVYSQSRVKLPTIKLPTFNGLYDRWLEFRDSFAALVDGNNTISEIQKFYYLRSSLEGEAAQLIESIEVSAANYSIAWGLLTERYENKKLLVHNYVKAFFDAPALTKESHSELRKLYDTFTKNLRSLHTLGQPTNEWDTLIIHMLASKFDSRTRRDWESYKIEGELPTMSDINIFLKEKCDILEKLELNKFENKLTFNNKQKGKQFNSHVSTQDTKYSCYYCKANHAIYQCEKFLKLDLDSRIKEANRLQLCKNCLSPGHVAFRCKRSSCRKCNKKHNSLLHGNIEKDSEKSIIEPLGESSTVSSQPEASTSVAGHTINKNKNIVSQVLLSTALVNIRDKEGNIHVARALLDQGSQSHFITDSLCNKLSLKRSRINCAISGVGQARSEADYEIPITIMSRINNFSMDIFCLVLPKITQPLPIYSFDQSLLQLPKNIQLADPNFNVSNEIDMLLGISVFYKLICMKQIQREGHPVLQKTKLGWVVGGNLCSDVTNVHKTISCHTTNIKQIDDNLTKFWELENCDISQKVNTHDICESNFLKTHTRDSTGRFTVDIPLKPNFVDLGDSKKHAMERFYYLEKRFDKNPSLKKDYVEFMTEYKHLGHMTRFHKSENDESLNYYLPHHAVVKNSSITTKVRVVFDASAKTDNGLSLNDVQYAGPTIQSDLFSIILRFRLHTYVISADVSKMYRQVLINPQFRKFQRIFWREEPDQELEVYELNTVTYGTSSAPFLAVRCLHQLGLDNVERCPKASQVIMRDFYIDDLLTGSDSPEEIIQVQREVTNILLSGGFELRKWLSNDPELTNKFLLNNNIESSILQLGEHEQNKTLGVLWNSSMDTIQYSIRHIDVPAILTKRLILSITAQIFDPLGLLGPIVIVAKLILQLLWQEKITWDEPVPIKIYNKWNNFAKDLSLLNNLSIPRHVINQGATDLELHAFADASQSAYGACVYIRCKLTDGSYLTKLLCAKSRVAPLKTISLPRLELCAAVLLANLVYKVRSDIDTKFSRFYYWSDSQITLCWIKGPPSRWKTFIANRVSEIQQLTDENDWHYVASAENCADLLSRGVSCEQLLKSNLWWQGPSFLERENSSWNLKNNVAFDSTEIPEQKVLSNVTNTEHMQFDLFSKYSSLLKLQRVTAYCYRFISNLRRQKAERMTGPLTTLELDNSLRNLIKISQIQSFSVDYSALKNKKRLRNSSNILSLNPFLDKDELIRVGGRIQNANISYNKKHPILLHNKHILTELLISHKHKVLLHCGPQQLLYAIRENYWPISGRNLARKIVQKCIVCAKAKPKPCQYIMGDLPQNRVNECLPFVNTGLDYAGPLTMKDRKTRGAKLLKVYICIFICLSTKAIHVELVSDLTTEAFLATLKRFMARRGKPSNLYSDNAKTFVGADAALKRLINSNSDHIATDLANMGVSWHFIPPRSPNFGGLWEAGVKSIKSHLKRVLGNAHLNYEDLNTVLCQIEGVLNSRPLSPLSSNPTDLDPLTPGHFLIGRPISAIPEPNLLDKNEARLSKYQRLQHLTQHFWKKWQHEYLGELQTRVKWRQQEEPVQVNELVIVKEDNLPPGQWRLGRILQLHPGSDGVVRVVTVKCCDSEKKRPLTKICRLPINDKPDHD